MKNVIALICLAASCLCSTAIFSQTVFTGAVDADWFNADNWNDGLPGPSNPDAVIPEGATVVVNGTILNNGVIVIYGSLFISAVGTIENYQNIANLGFVFNDGSIYSCTPIGYWDGSLPNGNPLITTGCPPSPFGCTDILACNYNPNAEEDDGSCILPDGCTDPTACNYDSTAGCDDGTCLLPDGCTDSTACNYDATATCDNGTCVYGLWYLPNNVGVGPVTLSCSAPEGYYLANQECIENVIAVDPFCVNTNWDAICMRDYNCCLGIYGCGLTSACNYDNQVCWDNTLCTYPGCTDSSACNYDPSAGCDDGSCILPDGCTDPAACNYAAAAICDDGSCTYPGCTDSAACNYDAAAICEDGSCDFSCYGCADAAACNYDLSATIDDGSCVFPGCTNPTACNFDVFAGCDDGSCLIPTCDGASGCSISDVSNTGFPLVSTGLSRTLTINSLDMNGMGNVVYVDPGQDISIDVSGDYSLTETDGVCPGCDAQAYGMINGEYSACLSWDADGPFTFSDLFTAPLIPGVYYMNTYYSLFSDCETVPVTYPGFVPATGSGQTTIATIVVGGATCSGCTDIGACNYDPTAGYDDGSCIFPDGCTDPAACNYDPTAGCDDGSCLLPDGCTCDDLLWYLPNNVNEGPATQACSAPEGYYLANQECIETVIAADPYCVNDSWDEFCMKDYNCCLGIYGCRNSFACNFDPLACEDNSLCTYSGCTDPTACNYDPTAGCDDGSCILPDGCTCDDFLWYLPNNVNEGPATQACSAPEGYYLANQECIETVIAADAYCVNNTWDYSCMRAYNCCLGIYGCRNFLACNFDPVACEDNSLCTYSGCTDPTACNYDPTAGCDDGTCILTDGCTDPAACNYAAAATCDDGSCTYSGCTDPTACNYDPTAGCDDGSCILPDGCTDPAACNYDCTAICDNGSCTYPGCTNPVACNYNVGADCDDGSCLELDPCGVCGGATLTPEITGISGTVDCQGDVVTLVGVNLCSVTSVTVGGTEAFIYDSTPTAIIIETPTGSGIAEVIVTTPAGSASISLAYNGPFIFDLLPPSVSCQGGDFVSVVGNNLCGVTAVTVGGTEATIVVSEPGAIVFEVPAGSGIAEVLVTTPSGNASALLSYDQPMVVDVLASSISCQGGDFVTLLGDNLCGVTSVTVGGTEATIVVSEPDNIVIEVPAWSGSEEGFPQVLVTTPSGQSTAFIGSYTGLGCTDPIACNYDALANCDDASCEYISCSGCIYAAASNYDATATIDDGSCEFEVCDVTSNDQEVYDAAYAAGVASVICPEVDPCPMDLNNDNSIGTSDLLELLGVFGTTCPE